VLNRDGGEIRAPEKVREYIVEQLVRPVRWDMVMARLLQMGISDFVEIGPGRVLRGLVRLNASDPSVAVHNVSDVRSLERTALKLAD
jgi:[acyl-carrier-protein] S-malonyltransferase